LTRERRVDEFPTKNEARLRNDDEYLIKLAALALVHGERVSELILPAQPVQAPVRG
jgi:hypothetical protein